MNDKMQDALAALAAKAGVASDQAWPLLVQYAHVKAIYAACEAAVLLAAVVVMWSQVARLWKRSDGFESAAVVASVVIGGAVSLVFAITFFMDAETAIVGLVSPHALAVRMVLDAIGGAK